MKCIRFLMTLAGLAMWANVSSGETGVRVQVAEADSAMVVSGHREASSIGIAVLEAGGNAIDAAVAVSLALGVAEPYGSGLGGKLALLYRDAATGEVYFIEALDAAPSGLDPEAFRAAPAAERGRGGLSVGVPGLPAGLMLAHEQWGLLPRQQVIAPVIALAREGFTVEEGQVRFFQSQQAMLRRHEGLTRLYLREDQPPKAGDRLANEDLAATLELLAQQGASGFYAGPVAEAIVTELQRRGNPITLDDFAAYRAHLLAPLSITFRGTEIFSAAPPVSGGGTYLLALAALEDEQLAESALFSPAALDRVMRVFLECDAAARSALGDAPDSRERLVRLLTPEQLALLRERSRQTEPALTSSFNPAEGEAMAAETTHFVVVDAAGNVASVTQSQSLHFGSGIVPPGTGVILNNSLSNFALSRGGVNEVQPNRRPRTTITPAIWVRHGRPMAALGLPGGARIPSAMVQVTVAALAFDQPLDVAIAAPRFHPLGRPSDARELSFQTELETDRQLAQVLRDEFGWSAASGEGTEVFGGVNAVEFLPDGRLRGYADQRRSNAVVGF
jgi:gamma-glutamyltranspeptidase / glutathione hydrolase